MSYKVSSILFFCGALLFSCQGDNLTFPPNDRKGGEGESCLTTDNCQANLICWEQKCLPSESICRATEEICDGVDNNCNQIIDEGFNVNQPCTVTVDFCSSEGKFVCSSSTETICQAPEIKPTSEICNGIDDDCNGKTDDFVLEDGQNCWVKMVLVRSITELLFAMVEK